MWHELFINRNSKIKNVVVCTRNQTIIGKFLIIHGHDSLPHPLKFLTAQHQTTTCYLLIVSFVVVVAQERSSSLEDAAGQIRRVQRGGVHHISTGLKSWTNFLLLSYPKTIWPTSTLKFVLQSGRWGFACPRVQRDVLGEYLQEEDGWTSITRERNATFTKEKKDGNTEKNSTKVIQGWEEKKKAP